MTGADPFGTASVRERVLAAWSASPARLREDANAEEDFSLGGYRDRVVVELAQNAADAAAAAGVPGRLRLSLTRSADGDVLAAANTGAPLDAAGVEALATLRASAKTGGAAGGDPVPSVGRFGVGFAAVLSVSDEPILLSHNGSVRFSRADTAQLLHDLDQPALTEEVRRRDGHVPALRLPFEAEGEPPQGFSTVVLLPLRDEAATDLVRRLLDELDDALLLALPALSEVEVEVDGVVRVLRDVADRWHTAARSGTFSAAERRELFADRPTEEAHRPWWSVLWAVPTSPETAVPQVLHAPTPTDEPISWPALLLASFPLEPSRRHVAPGPLADRLVAEAAATYAHLLGERAAAGDDVLQLVPTGLGAGAVDAALRLAAVPALQEVPILRAVEDGALLRPREAVVIDQATPAMLSALAPFVGGLIDSPPGGRTALRQLGVQRLDLSEVVEALPNLDDPAAWAERYAALASLGEQPEGREALGVLPVPLADGRVVRGARGLLVPPGSMSADVLEPLAAVGVRLVHPDAVHPLLTRLGAVPATAREILEDAGVRELVETSPDADDPDDVAAVVLGLARAAVADGELAPGDLPWLGDLALPDADDELAPAAALALPGSPAANLLDPDEIGLVAAALVEEFGARTLVAVGVLDGFATVAGDDVDLADPPEELTDLDGFADWASSALGSAGGAGAVAGTVLAVRDLEVVRAGSWPEVVAAIASSPLTRPALVERVRVRDRRGVGTDVAPYTSWWLRRELGLDVALDPAGDRALATLLDPAPGWVAELDDEVRRALGVVREFADLGASAAAVVIDRLGADERPMALSDLLGAWAWLAARSEDVDVAAPTRVRALTPAGPAVVPSTDAVVIDEPMWLQRNEFGAFVIAPSGLASSLADVLDLDLATERAGGRVTSDGSTEPVPALDVLRDGPGQWCRHLDLQVDGVSVGWWVDGEGVPHANDARGLSRALAWAAGHWQQRFLLSALYARPDDAAGLVAEAAFD